MGKIFLLATILDLVYQLVAYRGVYTLELLITAQLGPERMKRNPEVGLSGAKLTRNAHSIEVHTSRSEELGIHSEG